jgi:hypothetical protein
MGQDISDMNTRPSWRDMRLAITLLFTLVVGCTQAVVAYIRIEAHDTSKVDHSLRIELTKLGWTADEKSSRSAFGETVYRHASLRSYYVQIDHAKGKVVEIAFIGVGRDFSSDAIAAYRSLVARLQTVLGDAVKHDMQTSSGQWIGD